ncbi:hypothetical protein RBE51_22040 [Pseudomonas taiwanensis]|uniref:hypothetical protein n=1 Tax=Pseudomonas taiwanensis TaxID=470150 RepID=UPI0028DDC888|nr:hypothetical protein [Pseudomonas taiwanensis]MDT8925469.1 hypothetical protein [Pseudomonas taiwanensis]
MLIYYGKPGLIDAGGTCTIRLGIAPAAGWTPGAVARPTAIAFGTKANVLTLFDKSGKPSRAYNLSKGGPTSDGGYYRDSAVDCAEMRAFYYDLGYFTKATLTP